jgi:hypothetical protein
LQMFLISIAGFAVALAEHRQIFGGHNNRNGFSIWETFS